MNEPRWLPIEVVVAAHSRQIRKYGGPEGLRDRAALESALARPINQFHHSDADLASLAAAYGFGLARNHAFVDGNKRISFISIVLFLALNGVRLHAPQEMVIDVVLRLASGELGEAELAEWIRGHIPP